VARPGRQAWGSGERDAGSAGAYDARHPGPPLPTGRNRAGENGRPGAGGRPAPSSRSPPGLPAPAPAAVSSSPRPPPGLFSLPSARPVLPSPSSPQRPGGTWEVSGEDSAGTEHPLRAQLASGGAGGLHAFVELGTALSPVRALFCPPCKPTGWVLLLSVRYKRKPAGPEKLTYPGSHS
jgi:hypothetical protein